EKIYIMGNTKTIDKVIRRELEITEAEPYSITKLKRSKQNLMRLGYFKDVNLSTEKGSSPDKLNVKISVEEAPTGSISGGVGFSSIEQLFAVFQIQERNLFGTGRQAGIVAQLGTKRQFYDISFTEPRFYDTNLLTGFDVFNLTTTYLDFSRRDTGGALRFGYPLPREMYFTTTYRYELIKIFDVSESASTFLKEAEKEGERRVSSIVSTISKSTLNNPIDPTSGLYTRLSVGLAGAFLGGNTDFIKTIYGFRYYWPLRWDLVYMFNGEIGYGRKLPSGDLPLIERFFLGGINTVRGYRSRSLGPKDPKTGDVIGGNKELFFNNEISFPIVKEAGLKGVVFLDAGNAFSEGEDLSLSDLRVGAGWGIRWLSPLGPIRIELGYPINKKKGDKSQVIEFSIGRFF
ncbi:MAG: outer membrane protein assembly factor BamA, partial [Candidatus Aenigmatarchaeota archaeon]